MNTEEKYTLIEKYLAGEMQGEELTDFEKALLQDDDLKEELELHQQVATTLKGDGIHSIRNVLHEVDKNWEDPSKQSEAKIVGFNFRKLVSIAAAIVLLFFGYQWLTQESLSVEELYATNFEAYPMILNQRSVSETDIDLTTFNIAISDYSKKQYSSSLAAFEKLILEQPNNITYQFYKANILIASKKPNEAIPIFENILAQKDHLFLEQTRWYLALAFLQSEQLEKAKTALRSIQNGQFKFKEAQGILEELS